MYLVDTNVWLERLLDQDRSDDVGRFIGRTRSDRLFLTDFSFHSIAVILSRLNQKDALLAFVRDAFTDGDVGYVRLAPGDTERLLRVADQFGLDWDDAYQYIAAEKHNLTIISFDGDFDKTERGRKTPAEALKE